MAVTALWPIKSRLDKVISYVRNPEKVTEEFAAENAALHTIGGVMEYAADDAKTERREYVSCLNCSEATAAKEFLEVKQFWRKTDGRLCYHGYQSFRRDDCGESGSSWLSPPIATPASTSRIS